MTSPAVAQQALAIPEGLPFELLLTQDIDTATAAVGDRISAQLASAIRDSSSTILAPAGSAVTGRIEEMRHLYQRPSMVLVSYRLESQNIGDKSGDVLETTASPQSRSRTRRTTW